MARPTKGERTPGSGRAPGASNHLTREVKQAIELAFEQLGGAAYLVEVGQTKPEVFCALLGKILPKQVDSTGAMEILYRIHRGPKPE